MATYADQIFRDFERYTGDGLPNEPIGAPLPTGDPASGAHNVSKRDLRDVFLLVDTVTAIYTSRAALVTAVTGVGTVWPVGAIFSDGSRHYKHTGSGSVIPDMPGWVPYGDTKPQHFGAVGNGVTDDRAAFAAMNAYGGTVYIPKPGTAYVFSSPLDLDNVAVIADPAVTWAALTDSGKLTWDHGAVTSQGAVINRLLDRVFIGKAAHAFAGNSLAADGGNSWFSVTAQAPSYLPINGQLVVEAGPSQYAIVAAARGSELAGTGVITFGSALVNDKAGGRGWGAIYELQHEPGAFVTNGFEVVAKNKSTDDFTYAPYLQTYGVFGCRMVAGGDGVFGGDAVSPSNSAMIVIRNETTTMGWNRGVVFHKDALTGTDGSSGSTGTGVAIAMARRHAIRWDAPDNTLGAQIISNVTVGTAAVFQQFGDNLINWLGANGKQAFRISHAATGVNYLQASSAVAGGAVSLAALGDDTNIDLRLDAKGTGNVRFGTLTANADAPVTGYITIKDAGGTTRKLAVIA